jgi:cytochrome c oxidase subunit II
MNVPHHTWRPAAGSASALIQELSVVLYVACALIFLLVMVLLLRAVFTPPRKIEARRWLTVGGLVFPGTVLSALLAYSLAVGSALADFEGKGTLRFLLDCLSPNSRALMEDAPGPAAGAALRIEVIAHQWWWEVRYFTDDAGDFELANELRIPAGRAVDVHLLTHDVIHSFWVPTLAGKVDMIPGRRNRLVLKSDEPGEHHGICAEYCGGQHALMGFRLVVLEEREFAAWSKREADDAAEPADASLQRGAGVFLEAGCADCHTVRGTRALGQKGPDLTHVGARRTLAAGALANHIGTMTAWVVHPQDLKPGSSMPDNRTHSGADLRALAAWLESLK